MDTALVVESKDIDADRFVQLVGAASHGRPRDRLDLLSEALGLWRGAPYDGLVSAPLPACSRSPP